MKVTILNAIYFFLVFSVALAIATLAMTRKINSFQNSAQPIILYVQKQEITVSNPTKGEVRSVLVSEGQHVKKGAVLIELVDDDLRKRIALLQGLGSNNLSARTEAALLGSQNPENVLVAPRDGVIYQVTIAQGAYLTQSTPLLTMYTDDDVKLVGYVQSEEYIKIQKQKRLDVYNPRFGQLYSIVLEGAGKVIPATKDEEAKYELFFHFSDPNEGAAFIQGEGVEIVSESKNIERYTPAAAVAKFWNSFIIEK